MLYDCIIKSCFPAGYGNLVIISEPDHFDLHTPPNTLHSFKTLAKETSPGTFPMAADWVLASDDDIWKRPSEVSRTARENVWKDFLTEVRWIPDCLYR